jgi:outer membrane biogenesis lipoprotein LolB
MGVEMKSLRYHVLATAAALIAACAMTTAPAAFAAATNEASHDQGHAMPSKLTLDQGRKWGTTGAGRHCREQLCTIL